MRQKRCKQQRSAMPNIADGYEYLALYRETSDRVFADLANWLATMFDAIGSNPTFDDLARDQVMSGVAGGFTRALKVIGDASQSSRGVTEVITRHLLAAERRANLPVQVGELAAMANVGRRRTQDWLHGRETGIVIDNRLTAAYERERKRLCK